MVYSKEPIRACKTICLCEEQVWIMNGVCNLHRTQAIAVCAASCLQLLTTKCWIAGPGREALQSATDLAPQVVEEHGGEVALAKGWQHWHNQLALHFRPLRHSADAPQAHQTPTLQAGSTINVTCKVTSILLNMVISATGSPIVKPPVRVITVMLRASASTLNGAGHQQSTGLI